jgi:hypothetical protein
VRALASWVLMLALPGALALVANNAGGAILSGTNGLIAVQSGSGSIVAADPVGGGRTTLLNSTSDSAPEVAPNGTKVAMVSGGNIFVADFPSGGNRLQVTTTGGFNNPAWNPDSSTLVFNSSGGLHTAQAIGSATVSVLTGSLPGDNEADYSPDGNSIVFDVGSPPTGISRITVSNNARTALNGATGGDDQPRIAANSSLVYFGCTDSGGAVCTLPWPNGGSRGVLAGTTGALAVPAATDVLNPFPAPDGTKVLFTTNVAASCPAPAPPCVKVVNANGSGGLQTVVATQSGDQNASWSRNTGGATPTPVPGTTATPTTSPGATASATASVIPNPNTPVFSVASGCGVLVVASAFAPPLVVHLSASDADAGQSVFLTASGLPPATSLPTLPNIPIPTTLPSPIPSLLPTGPGTSWATFSSTAGNPATATLSFRPGIFDWLLNILNNNYNIVVTAADNVAPARSSRCTIPLRVTLLNATL